jgi:hypothetical protein
MDAAEATASVVREVSRYLEVECVPEIVAAYVKPNGMEDLGHRAAALFDEVVECMASLEDRTRHEDAAANRRRRVSRKPVSSVVGELAWVMWGHYRSSWVCGPEFTGGRVRLLTDATDTTDPVGEEPMAYARTVFRFAAGVACRPPCPGPELEGTETIYNYHYYCVSTGIGTLGEGVAWREVLRAVVRPYDILVGVLPDRMRLGFPAEAMEKLRATFPRIAEACVRVDESEDSPARKRARIQE